ncbi:uncharacterized protein LOC129589935 isoform X2 [Paramacrobiotus metropolitanus]|uniref:uncharacterized protein LOC129589935 isoform X2 n=1 Tax=Paramacrobiotus metropolitanus TaxID=2943436 RepID=UPI0024458D97|nr:uncharacterized protein LOC129589935 isoform X2 [Paramacrobiotus metropolitanus]XP_055340848.1 uncharacterized protein LOC129589935 isoform X2 [Paramacrobiotus metropolitanus]XP_055340849.1 uncharacterized protein LOC129589935 isoform X2 [Paramacrobiotus metropolitanus]XP_055340850.1 uncharacterized protein LOC129589935 isoform X2 [Paramacrobiotus metropolitanus]
MNATENLSDTADDSQDAKPSPEWSFRLFSPKPITVQDLPYFQKQIMKILLSFIDTQKQSLMVFMWNPDVDNGTAINFFIRLVKSYRHSIYLDSRMLYADGIYKRLEEARFRPDWLRGSFALSRAPVVQPSDPHWERFLADCDEGKKLQDLTYGWLCPLRPTFALHYIVPPNSALAPQSGTFNPYHLHTLQEQFMETVLANVTKQFAIANPLTVMGAGYKISLVSHAPLAQFRTIRGYIVFCITMAFALSNLTSGRIEHIWRFPTSPGIFQPYQPFRVYPTAPVNYQLLPMFESLAKERACMAA